MRVYLDIMGEDFVAHVEFRVTSYGYPAMWDDPGAAPEYDITSITLYRDMPGKLGPAFEATGALLRSLAWSDQINSKIIEEIEAEAAERRRRNRRRRYA